MIGSSYHIKVYAHAEAVENCRLCDASAARECALHILCSVIGKCFSVEVVSKEFRIERDIMRLDKFLKVSRLIKRRTVANEACDAGRVLINDKPAKASANVKVGDVLTIQFGNKDVKVEILDVQETVKKDEAKELFKYL